MGKKKKTLAEKLQAESKKAATNASTWAMNKASEELEKAKQNSKALVQREIDKVKNQLPIDFSTENQIVSEVSNAADQTEVDPAPNLQHFKAIPVGNRANVHGKMLGQYQILEPLGRGGMSHVYRAYHAQLDRYVAVKVMRSDLTDDETFIGRFRNEARAIASLRHAHIVQVFDFNISEDACYMVMELLEGDTLKTRLTDYRTRNEKMPHGEIIRVLLDTLDGLDYAHENGMVHRDIKPANILLTKKGRAVLGDFGIAQMMGNTRHTMTGALMGTLNYMAPEQGLHGDCDVRSDLYSVGIVLYEMLIQTTPFDADTPLATLMKHLNDPLPLPERGSMDLPVELERVLLKSLSKSAADRYQSADEMAHALQHAAKANNITIPTRISLPLSFKSDLAPDENVSVFSGKTAKTATQSPHARDDTFQTKFDDMSMFYGTPSKGGEAQPLKTTSKPKVVSMPIEGMSQKQPPKVIPTPANTQENKGFLNFGVLFLVLNCIAVAIETSGTSFFERGWPFELVIVAAGFNNIMRYNKNYKVAFPALFFTGLSAIMMYSSLGNNWNNWAVIGPLMPVFILGCTWLSNKLAKNDISSTTATYFTTYLMMIHFVQFLIIFVEASS